MKKILLIILDGMADVGKKTPLMLANKPNIDWLASHSECGLWKPSVPKNYSLANFSEIGTLELLGCFQCPGRGYLEALGIGLKIDKKAVYFRTNFATVKKIAKRRKNSKKLPSNFSYDIIDRRAGRDEKGLDELAKAINRIKIDGTDIKFYRSSGHRGVLVLKSKNPDFSHNISDADIGKSIVYTKPLDKDSKRIADVLNEFMDKVYDVLSKHPINRKRKIAANFLLIRGAGHYLKPRLFKKTFGSKGAIISDTRIIDGIGRFWDMDVYHVKGADGGYDSNIVGQVDKAIHLLNNYEFVLLHVKGTDIASHDKNPRKKKDIIEKIDKEIAKIIKLKHINIILTADHITSSKTGMHENGNVPFLLYNPDKHIYYQRKFSENNCRDFITKNPMKLLMENMK